MTEATGISLSALASSLSNLMKEIVVDRTGVTGTFDVKLSAAPRLSPAMLAQIEAQGLAPDFLSLPRLEDAVRDQLGLRLQPATVDVSVYVIDRVERPTAN